MNLIHFKEKLTFLTSFLPQVIFMCSIFGYMIVLILAKWNQQWASSAPSIIKVMIEMVMKLGYVVWRVLRGVFILKDGEGAIVADGRE
jgi:V-type H+-transporting ATPase subunit a